MTEQPPQPNPQQGQPDRDPQVQPVDPPRLREAREQAPSGELTAQVQDLELRVDRLEQAPRPEPTPTPPEPTPPQPPTPQPPTPPQPGPKP